MRRPGTRMPAGLVALLATGAAVAGTALAQDHGMPGHGSATVTGTGAVTVSAGFSTYTPALVRVLAGEEVRWTNDSARAHTVTADDGRFDSGRLASGDGFSARVQTAGDVPYHCELHAGMTGTIEARTILLDAPAGAAAPRRTFPLTGRSAFPPGTEVRLQADTGDGFRDVARTTTDTAGRFAARVVPPGSGALRAVAGQDASPPVTLRVLDRRVVVHASRAGGHDVVRVRVTPPDPGGRVVLSLAIPERFGWWPVRQVRLDRRSQASLAVRTQRRLRARVVLTLPDGATPLARSRVFHVGGARG